MQWEKQEIGCYWRSGDYTICTVAEVGAGGIVTVSGYRVIYRRKPLPVNAECPFGTLEDAKACAEQHAENIAKVRI